MLKKVIAIILLIIFSNALLNDKREIFLAKYFRLKKTGFYVDVRQNEKPHSSLYDMSALSSWQGLAVNAPNRKPNALQDSMNTLYFRLRAQDQGGNPQQLSISLNDLCSKYFLRRPEFMQIAIDSVQAVKSTFWQNSQCWPDLLAVTSNSEINTYIQQQAYVNKYQSEGFTFYLKKAVLQAYDLQKAESQKAKLMFYPWAQIQANLVKQIEAEMGDEQGIGKLQTYSTHENVISIESLAENMNIPSSNNKIRNILVNKALDRRSLVILGSKDYRIEKLPLGSRILQTARVSIGSQVIHLYYLVEGYTNIFEQILQVYSSCTNFLYDFQINIRNGVTGNDRPIQNGIPKESNPLNKYKFRSQTDRPKPSQHPLQTPKPKPSSFQDDNEYRQYQQQTEQQKPIIENQLDKYKQILYLVILILIVVILVLIIVKLCDKRRPFNEKS